MSEPAQVKSPRVAAMFGGDRVSFVLGGRFRSFLAASEQGQRVIAELKKEVQDLDLIAELSDIALWVANRSSGRVAVDDRDQLRLDGKIVDYGLAGRIVKVMSQGFDFDALARFIEKVDENPDKSVAADLFRFLEKGNMPLTPEGNFLAFKKVDNDLLSYRSGANGRVKYPLGGIVTEARELCDPNRNITCSTGLHVCSYEYLSFWYRQQGRLLICEVNPRDVTAVPNDHNDQKLRTCRLRVMAEIPEADAEGHFQKAVDDRYQPAASEIVEKVEEALVDWTYEATWAGAEAGKADAGNGYDQDPSFAWADHADVPPDHMDDYIEAFREAYDAAYEATKAAAWWMERAVEEGLNAGKAQATRDRPDYDNDVGDAGIRIELVRWVEAVEPDRLCPEDHDFVAAFDRAYRDAYHNTYNGRG